MTERRGSGRAFGWWRRVLDHFDWDDATNGAASDGVRASVSPAVPHASLRTVPLDQLLLRAADRRTQRGAAAG